MSSPRPQPRRERPPSAPKETPPAARGFRRFGKSVSRTTLWIAGGLVALLILLVIASFFVDEPLRRTIERGMNESLTGYKVTLPRAHFQLLGLAVTLHGLIVRQKAHPDPPVAVIPRLRASLHWKELLSLHLVSNFSFDRPRIYLNLPQVEQEASDATPLKDKGWQEAALKIFPFKINLLQIHDGDVTYIDEDPQRPLHLTRVNVHAENIRNIRSREHVYPSPVHADAVIFESGRGSIDGHANFLAEPFPGLHVLLDLRDVPLDRFKPMIGRSNLDIRGGTLGTAGEVEYSPQFKLAHLRALEIRGMRLDYVHTPATATRENERKRQVGQAAKKAANASDLVLKLDRLDLKDCELGMVNRAKNPPYRVFLAGTNLSITNLSNHFSEGPAQAHLTARFMGSGAARADARFRPESRGPDFDLKAEIVDTQMTGMNELFRAYGKFDVTGGFFSFYSDLHVKNGQISGYVKPLFRDVQVYDPAQDRHKSALKKLYERLVQFVAGILENRQRKEVATEADIEGTVGQAHASTWQVIGRLIENAFFRAILPGFDEVVGIGKRRSQPARAAS